MGDSNVVFLLEVGDDRLAVAGEKDIKVSPSRTGLLAVTSPGYYFATRVANISVRSAYSGFVSADSIEI
jgi:hypothetical protein